MTTILLPMPTSTNRLWRSVGRRVIKSAAYRAWINEAGWRLKEQRPAPVKGPVSLSVTVGKTRSDLSNHMKAIEDLLVLHEIIEGDGPAIVRKINLDLDEAVTGCVVTIEPFNTFEPIGNAAARVVENLAKKEAAE